jgi:hypothetical protein
MPDNRILFQQTDALFWDRTGYKPGQRLDPRDPQDREMVPIWRQIFSEVRGIRDRATAHARDLFKDTRRPFIFVGREPDKTMIGEDFPNRGELDARYSQQFASGRFAYIAAFDFTQDVQGPVVENFLSPTARPTPVATAGEARSPDVGTYIAFAAVGLIGVGIAAFARSVQKLSKGTLVRLRRGASN